MDYLSMAVDAITTISAQVHHLHVILLKPLGATAARWALLP